jgi:S-adenosylmethionine:tRNA ribosyltransferase-isomerase
MPEKKIFPDQIKIEEYNYNLPDKYIAKYPLEKRDQSKLLVYKNKVITNSVFQEIDNYIETNDLLFFNNTKVIPARLKFQKSTGANIEIFCLEPINPADYAQSFQSETCTWKCIVGNLKKWKESRLEKTIEIEGKQITLYAEKTNHHQTSVNIQFSWTHPGITFEKIIEAAGITPIPPYLNRESEEIDKTRYQTIYSSIKGSVAAPTAGLHFTDLLINKLKKKGIHTGELTLHVGAGTFKPVQSEIMGDHTMHTEFFTVSRQAIEQLYKNAGNIISVGTTTLRTLESLYWIAVKQKLNSNSSPNMFAVNQWDPYQIHSSLTFSEAMEILLEYIDKNNQNDIIGSTQIIIVPGYTPKSIKALVTNFHQPKSTLLLLIASITGNDWKTIYQYALDNNYRFLSYGDSSLLFV